MATGAGAVPSIKLPGTDVLRNLVLCVLSVLLLTAALLVPPMVEGWMKGVTALLGIVALFLGFGALAYGAVLEDHKDVERMRSFFVPKFLAMMATITFFLGLCLWVLALGGVVRSPFAAFLTVSPVFYVAVLITQRDREAFEQHLAFWKDVRGEAGVGWATYLRTVLWMQVVPLILIVLTIGIGELVLSSNAAHAWYFDDSKELEACRESMWFSTVSYGAFYLGVLFSVAAVVPPEKRKALRRAFV